jgi:hypothetical protein
MNKEAVSKRKPEPLQHIPECSAPNDVQICPRCIARENANATKVTTELQKALKKADAHVADFKQKNADLIASLPDRGDISWKGFALTMMDALNVCASELRMMFRRDAMTSDDKAAVARMVEMLERVHKESP